MHNGISNRKQATHNDVEKLFKVVGINKECKMSKTLTQEVFKDAPDWVKSASVDIEGDLYFHGCKADDLIISPICGWFLSSSQHKSSIVDKGYDAEWWEDSPIDRE